MTTQLCLTTNLGVKRLDRLVERMQPHYTVVRTDFKLGAIWLQVKDEDINDPHFYIHIGQRFGHCIINAQLFSHQVKETSNG